MSNGDSKSYQLRVRVTAEERDLLEKLGTSRNRGETLSDLVREAIALLVKGSTNSPGHLSTKNHAQVQRLADLLKREPHQVEEACIEGIFDLIEAKCDVPLIVMETHLHLKYHNREEKDEVHWNTSTETAPKVAIPVEPQPVV